MHGAFYVEFRKQGEQQSMIRLNILLGNCISVIRVAFGNQTEKF
jgi:hypothetical protein